MQEMKRKQVWSLGWEDPLKESMATNSSILAWKFPLREEPGGLQSMGSQKVVHDWKHTHKTKISKLSNTLGAQQHCLRTLVTQCDPKDRKASSSIPQEGHPKALMCWDLGAASWAQLIWPRPSAGGIQTDTVLCQLFDDTAVWCLLTARAEGQLRSTICHKNSNKQGNYSIQKSSDSVRRAKSTWVYMWDSPWVAEENCRISWV